MKFLVKTWSKFGKRLRKTQKEKVSELCKYFQIFFSLKVLHSHP